MIEPQFDISKFMKKMKMNSCAPAKFTRIVKGAFAFSLAPLLCATGSAIGPTVLAVMAQPQHPSTAALAHVKQASHSSQTSVPSGVTPDEAANIRVYKNCNRAVVNIASISAVMDEFMNVYPHKGMGSGTIITQDGYILTNYHVINGAQQVKVTLYDGTIYGAQLVGDDPANDLAVIKINAPPTKKLTTIEFGDSNNLEVGRRVFAIGNPFGYDRSLTVGVVSSLGRTLKTDSERIIKGVIQVDAAINPGNSGGPLLDTTGRMIGINTAIMSQTGSFSGIGMAIPVSIAKSIVPELIVNHGVSRPDLGAYLMPIEKGLRVVKVDPNGPAGKAGLCGPKMVTYQDGPFLFKTLDSTLADIITSVDNVPVRTTDDLQSYIEQKKAGQVVTLTILRSGHTLKIPVKLTVVSPA